MTERLFNGLAEAFAYYTECALATAEGLEMVKKSSQAEKRRAWSIANGMVNHCRMFGVPPGQRTPRLGKRLERDA